MLVLGCEGAPGSEPPDGAVAEPEPTGELAGLPYGIEQLKRVCAHGYGDAISAKFCAGAPPYFTSLKDLIVVLNGTATPPPLARMVMTGESTGLGVRTTTPLNPRAVLLADAYYATPGARYMALTFARGEPLVELVANDPVAQTLRFFLIRFHPACESTPTGCNWADLLTPTIETGWTGYTIYDDDALKNTTLDCRSCHQPGGPGTPAILRMQELFAFWPHWFDSGTAGLNLFLTAHSGSDYYPAGAPPRGSPGDLQDLIFKGGFSPQPNVFDDSKIRGEVFVSGTSATWEALYEKAVTAQEIPPPYFKELQTDKAKDDAMISAYSRVMAGTLAREQLPDIRATIADEALAPMSIRPKPGLDGRGILVHMCGRCHNSRLDQSLTRARFNVQTLDTMSRAERDLAIERLRLPDGDQRKMPPLRFHELSVEERELAISFLMQ